MIHTKGHIYRWAIIDRSGPVLEIQYELQRVDDADNEIIARDLREHRVAFVDLPPAIQTRLTNLTADMETALRNHLATTKDPNPEITTL